MIQSRGEMLNKHLPANAMPAYSYRIVLKILLIVGFIIVGGVALLNFFFLDKLATGNLRQIKESARVTSIVVSDLAIGSFYSRDKTQIIDALDQVLAGKNDQESVLLQISVILFPSGIYYASSNKEFQNKRAGQTLLKKIELNNQSQTVSKLLNYEVNNRTQTVLQFLRNIYVSTDGKVKRIATVQVLYDYNRILKKTRESLFIVGGLILLLCFLLVGILFFPLSDVFRKLYEGMEEVGKSNFSIALPTGSGDETGILLKTFNRMNESLKEFVKKEQSLQIELLKKDREERSGTGHVLRKTEITCLCVRIPGIQGVIESSPSNDVDEYISEFIEPLEKTVKEYGGQIVKILGDKIYILFEGINSTDNSVRMALKVNRGWQLDNHERKVLSRSLRNYGIGLHSTEGIAGSLSRMSAGYTFIGEAAAVAEKLCSLAQTEEILISSSMMDKTSGAYLHQPVKKISTDDLGITGEILSITPLSADDAQTATTYKAPSALGPEGAGVDGVTGKSRSSFESSITDMLEETLITSPLDPLEDGSLNSGMDDGMSDAGLTGDQLEDSTRSLWEEFDSVKKDDES